jgi:hypothetical protein
MERVVRLWRGQAAVPGHPDLRGNLHSTSVYADILAATALPGRAGCATTVLPSLAQTASGRPSAAINLAAKSTCKQPGMKPSACQYGGFFDSSAMARILITLMP